VGASLERFHENVAASIKALQFEDIVNQLLTSVEGRLGNVRDLWTHWLAAQAAGTPDAWRQLDSLLAEVGPKLVKPSAVQQSSMATGTAEIF
jgi:hypothetical protein